jgi:hypothetical protein
VNVKVEDSFARRHRTLQSSPDGGAIDARPDGAVGNVLGVGHRRIVIEKYQPARSRCEPTPKESHAFQGKNTPSSAASKTCRAIRIATFIGARTDKRGQSERAFAHLS